MRQMERERERERDRENDRERERERGGENDTERENGANATVIFLPFLYNSWRFIRGVSRRFQNVITTVVE